MNKKSKVVDAPHAAKRAGSVAIRVPIVIADGYGEDGNTLEFTVAPSSYSIHVTNPDRPRGEKFLQERSGLTLDAALQAMRMEESYSPGLHGDSEFGYLYSIHAEGLEAWVKEVLGVGYVAHAAALAMAGRTVEELLRVRERFPEGLESDDCVNAFGQLFGATDGTRFETLRLEQMAQVAGCPDPIDIQQLADCVGECSDDLVPDAWLPKPRARRSPQ